MARMPRLLLALLIALCLPATAAAAPTCPPDSEASGPGPTFGIGPEHVLAGVPEREGAAGGFVVREGRHTARTRCSRLTAPPGAPGYGSVAARPSS